MPAMPRTILHADMDAFYAAIEQRDHPELRGKPVIVGGDRARQVVSTASYEARRFGVHSAMPGTRARRLCPDGIFVRPRMQVYAAVSEQIQAVFRRYTDLVEPLSLDEAFLDVTGSQALFGDGPAIARRIKDDVRRQTQLTVSVGVAATKFVAKVASDLDKPDGLTVVPAGTERAFLAPLPVGRLWGCGPVLQRKLQRRGLRTIGDLQQHSEARLRAWLGDGVGRHLWALASGSDPRAVEPVRQARTIGHELTFAEDLTTREQARAILLQLAEQTGRRLRRHGVRAGTVRLKLRLSDFATTTRQRRVPPTQDDLELLAAAAALFDEHWDGRRGVRLLGVTAADLHDARGPVQQSLFGAEPEARRAGQPGTSTRPDKQARVLAAMDAIRDRHGEGAVRHGLGRRESTPWGPERGAPVEDPGP